MSRYNTIRRIEDKNRTRIGTANLPEFTESNSDILLISTSGDRCDLLATEYYGDPTLWWFVATVNNLSTNNIPVGTQLRMPLTPSLAQMR